MATWFVGGQRYRRNFADEKAAHKEAADIAEKLSRGQAQALELTGADRDSYLDACNQLKPLSISLHDAVRTYAAATKLLKGQGLIPAVQFFLKHSEERLVSRTVQEVYEKFLAQQQSDGRSVRYIQNIRSRLGRFAKAFRMNIADIVRLKDAKQTPVETALPVAAEDLKYWLKKQRMQRVIREKSSFFNWDPDNALPKMLITEVPSITPQAWARVQRQPPELKAAS
jgi:hypothetical protein